MNRARGDEYTTLLQFCVEILVAVQRRGVQLLRRLVIRKGVNVHLPPMTDVKALAEGNSYLDDSSMKSEVNRTHEHPAVSRLMADMKSQSQIM